MKRSVYRDRQEAILASLTDKPRLLLQSCCGPCSSACLEQLEPYFHITVYFYNPNLFPPEEYEKRLATQRKLLVAVPFTEKPSLLEGEYDHAAFRAAVRGMEQEPENGSRCTECFRLRLTETARAAKQGGYDFFTTTLTVSPHKDAVRINALGEELEASFGVRFLPCDFKKKGGYQRSIELSRQYELYRQNYCGCEYSIYDKSITK